MMKSEPTMPLERGPLERGPLERGPLERGPLERGARNVGPGEAASRARSRRILVNFIVLGAIGGAVGFTAALVELPAAPLNAGGTLPAWFAILAVVVLVGAISVGNFFYYRSMDEVQRLDNYWATAVGANVLLMSYPIWLILWKGGLSPSPDAFVLYVVMFAATTLAYLWRKLR